LTTCDYCGAVDAHQPWCNRPRRVVARARVQGTPIRIFEDHQQRSWKPQDKATDEAMNCVLEVLIRRGRSYQYDLADEVAAVMDVKLGTARAYVSASLLYFREAGWVRLVEVEDGRAVWEIDG
jgi:hypothetical protein